jgi:hypothetical protein
MFKYKIVDNAIDSSLMVTVSDSTTPADKLHLEADLIPELVVLLTELIPICRELKAISGKRL